MFNVIIIGGENIPNYEIFQKECIYYLRDKAKKGERIRILTIGDSYIDKFASTFVIETKTFYLFQRFTLRRNIKEIMSIKKFR